MYFLIPDAKNYFKYAVSCKAEPMNSIDLSKIDISFIEGLITFLPMKNDTDYGYIAEYKNRIVMAFEGTRADIKAWISDFDAYPLRDALKSGPWGEGTIHDGFYSSWEPFKRVISDYIRDYGNDKLIYCIGKSRGGALSTLCARHLVKNLKLLNVYNITYGSPKVGTERFAEEYRKLPILSTRVVNGYDIVPELPPYDLGFRHVGNLIYLKQPRWHKYFSRIRDHLDLGYQKGLDSLLLMD